MTYTLRTQRKFTLICCLPLFALLTACGVPNNELYDANGNFTGNTTLHNISSGSYPPPPSGEANRRYINPMHYKQQQYQFVQRGYYDRSSYVSGNAQFNTPDNMYPPRGLCRVWFVDRVASKQPPVESCEGIQFRVPAGAYVLFGG